jgi:hypothetical protein
MGLCFAMPLFACTLAACSSPTDGGAANLRGTFGGGAACVDDSAVCAADGGAPADSAAAASDSATDHGGSDAELEPDAMEFAACRDDSDCVAVPQAGCCRLGYMAAVNRDLTNAYQASAACTDRRPVCPLIRIIDDRVAECDNATHHCTMVAVDKIFCGGFVRNQHHCPQGYSCVFTRHVPDIPGQCLPSDSGGE